MFRWLLLVISVEMLGNPPCVHAASTQVHNSPAIACRQLETIDFSSLPDAPTEVLSAVVVEASGSLPRYCQVKGYISPTIGMELRLPNEWNGKFTQTGCGGHCGVELEGEYASACDDALRRGYACLSSDMGHKGNVMDGLWGNNNLQAKIDWGFRATHVAALAGKAIVQRYYTESPSSSYFIGCSTGGRQALQEAQRFPWDFDGIVAGAPPVNLSTVYLTLASGIRATPDGTGKPILGASELKLLTTAAIAKCDLDDGVKDGVIGDPLNCNFNPNELACTPERKSDCLTPQQIDAAQKVYAGPITSEGRKLTLGGPLPGSEIGGWSDVYTGVGAMAPTAEALVVDGFRYLLFLPELGPAWNLRDFDFDRDYKRLALMQTLYDSSNPDLHEFKMAGGKLIIFHGMNDSTVIPRSTIEYYEKVERLMGGQRETQDFARLFLLPGVAHCSGGVGADAVDFLGYLERWRERGEEPNLVQAGHLKGNLPFAYPYRQYPADPSKLSFTRPLYPYPIRAKYVGHGDPNISNSFRPVGAEIEVADK